MFLFELAMELGERSADMAEAAPGLGLEGVTPTSELTSEQVQALRTRFTKAPVAAGPGGPPGGAAYHPPTGGPPQGVPGPTPPSSSGGMGIGQMVLIALAVFGVLGLFGFMIKRGGTDQQRLERIAAREPVSDGVPTTGPDGKPLTEEQMLDVAKLEAAKAAQAEKVCSVLRQVRNADIAMSNATKAADAIDELKALMIQASNEAIPLYDEAIPVIPGQADNMRKLQQFSRDTIAMVQGSGDLTSLQSGLKTLSEQAVANGTTAAATQLDAFAMETCEFSVGNN